MCFSHRLRLSLVATALLNACNSVEQAHFEDSPPGERPPNIVIIFTDDMGYADINPFNSADLQTPNLDRMAAEGALFSQFYVAQPVCSASRAALMTGSYSNRVGVQGAFFPESGMGLAPSETTLAEMLKSAGYVTGHFGKWHLGDDPKFSPNTQGFDTFFGILHSNDMWPHHPLQGTLFDFDDLYLLEDEIPVEVLEDQSDLTQRLTLRSTEFIRANRGQPFFLYLAHPQPHVPLFASERFHGMTGQGMYADVIAELDWSVGEILRTLREEGLDQDTLVMFTSDNGPWLAFGDHAGSAAPFREGKNTVFEGGVREPFLIRWPGHIPGGYRSNTPFMSIDIFPTLAGLVGAELPDEKIDGMDVWPILTGRSERSPQSAYFFYFGDNELQGVRYRQWKLYYPHTYQSLNGRPGGRGGQMGAYETLEVQEIELYDLENDPGETLNVAAEHPDVIARIESLAEGMRSDLGDSLRNREGSGWRPVGTVD